MTSRADRAALVAFAQASIARGSKSFAVASRLFDPRTRERAWLLYAWCRAADDIADGQTLGHGMRAVADPQGQLALIRDKTEAALAGRITGDLAFDALGLVVKECRIPARFPRDLIEGFALDASGFRPDSEQALYHYCYCVAGAVGCMMAIVMGVDPEDAATLDRACDLGIAFQLANIARDIREDAEAGRCYLPTDWLTEKGIASAELMRPEHRAALAELAARLADRAEAHEASARYGARALSFRSAWAVLAAAGIYGDIARAVRTRGADAWETRVIIDKGAKLGWIARAALQAAVRRTTPDPGRAGLYQRPD